MKTKSLKTFTKSTLNKKMKKDMKLTSIQEAAKLSTDLAHFAQMHYFLNDNPDKANWFSVITNFDIDDSNIEDSYVHRKYQEWIEKMDSKKDEYRDLIIDISSKLDITFYRIAKLLGTNQSNVNQFFKKANNNAISHPKLKKLLKTLQTMEQEKETV